MRDKRMLPVPLTTAELNERRDLLAQTVQQIVEVEDAKKKETAKYSGQLKELGGMARQAAREIRDRSVKRDVEIEYVHDPIRFCVDTFRRDTHELIDSRAMDEVEVARAKQLTLPSVERERRRRRGVANIDDSTTDEPA